MPDQAATQLTVRGRRLTAGDALLTCVYAAGDCDTCPWPMVSEFATPKKLRERLARALFDAREMGDIPGDLRCRPAARWHAVRVRSVRALTRGHEANPR
jgi:hypothetical protein